MTNVETINYHRIEKAISFIIQNHKSQPSLDEIATAVGLSSFHFQRLFHEWAGVSPKAFIQYLTIEHARKLLKQSKSLFDTAFEAGLSGTGRLHDLFIKIEAMTPAQFKEEGKGLKICYCFEETQFGTVLIASTSKGICYLTFCADNVAELDRLFATFPKAIFANEKTVLHDSALAIIGGDSNNELSQIKLHLRGTKFQLKVWEALLRIPRGRLATYGQVSEVIDNAAASRATGSAIGKNPVAFLIPCHRVIQASGITGNYMWGPMRKNAIIAWESAQESNIVHIA
jgi:AraC family transcriptional regulator of adaptative response/methylated-DNA-[protein]-cysteine methyltransferase